MTKKLFHRNAHNQIAGLVIKWKSMYYFLMSPLIDRKIIDISSKVKQEYDGVEIYLFGSTSRGTDSENSDIDLCFIFENPTERLRLISRRLRKEIYPELKKPLDILVYDKKTFDDRSSLPMTMESTIKTEGKRL